jgi:drug/metabolite transporter (DMT)-like permease
MPLRRSCKLSIWRAPKPPARASSTYVVLTPILTAVLLRERILRSTWVAVFMATAGLATLSLNGFGFGFGETVTLIAAAFYARHIIGLGRYSSPKGAGGLSVIQMVVIAIVSLVAAAPGGVELPHGAGPWASVLCMALMVGAVAIWVQTWAQSHPPATRAAIVRTLEQAFAVGFAVALGGESMTVAMSLGEATVIAAMYTVELLGRAADVSAEQNPPAELLHHEV